MFIAKQEIILGNGVSVAAGEAVENPTRRMKELGLVVEVQDTPKAEPVKPPKKEKKEKKVEVIEAQDEILVEDSAEISVETDEE